MKEKNKKKHIYPGRPKIKTPVRNKRVIAISKLDDRHMYIFDTIQEACDKLGVTKPQVYKGESRQWELFYDKEYMIKQEKSREEYEKYKILKKENTKRKRIGNPVRMTQIINECSPEQETIVKEYISCSAAAKDLGIDRKMIYTNLRDPRKRPLSQGYLFEYIDVELAQEIDERFLKRSKLAARKRATKETLRLKKKAEKKLKRKYKKTDHPRWKDPNYKHPWYCRTSNQGFRNERDAKKQTETTK